jgi:hypothetical protein
LNKSAEIGTELRWDWELPWALLPPKKIKKWSKNSFSIFRVFFKNVIMMVPLKIFNAV